MISLPKISDVLEATSLPGYLYKSPEVYEEELEKIFYSKWLLICHAEQIRKPGDIFVHKIGDKPIILVRVDETQISAFYNVCRHRGTKLVDESGNFRIIQCPYHGWTYKLDGELVGCPDMEDTVGFDRGAYPLHPIKLEIWAGFVFVNLDPNCQPLRAYLRDFEERFSKYRMERLRWVGRVGDYDIACNWKAYMENFKECYHCSLVHPETLGKYARQHIPYDPLKIRGPYSLYYFDDRTDAAQSGTADLGPLAGRPDSSAGTLSSEELSAYDLNKIYLPTIFPNTGMAIPPKYVVTYQAWPNGPLPSKGRLEFFAFGAS